jgi:O-antigen/teichoic acid export membrane protein
MLFLMLVYFYTSRVVLRGLGVEDYGIYNLVGGFVALFSLVSAALTGACSRFLNFEMGMGNKDKLSAVFSTSVLIQLILVLFVVVLAETAGLWYVNHKMVYPEERLVAANWCFQFSVLTFCMNLVTVPYNASVVAHEKMEIFSYVSIYQGIATLVIATVLGAVSFDKLIFYAGMLCLIQISVQFIYQIYCRKHFVECRRLQSFDKTIMMQMLSYSLWHFAGNGAVVLKTYGVDVVINLFFGPTVNAAKGITNQVEAAVQQFVGSFMMAMNPQITQSYAEGNSDYMLSLVNKGARFSFYLVLLLSLPIIINTHEVLNLWLGQVPVFAADFVRLTLVTVIVGTLSKPLVTAQNATGNVRNYQLVVGGIVLLNLPLSYLALKMGADAKMVMLVALALEIVALFVRVFMISFTVKAFRPVLFVSKVILNCMYVLALSAIVPYLMTIWLPQTNSTFILNVIICFLCTVASAFYVGCNKEERFYILSKAKAVRHKVLRR